MQEFYEQERQSFWEYKTDHIQFFSSIVEGWSTKINKYVHDSVLVMWNSFGFYLTSNMGK
jgi:hypothetical protein